MKYIINGKSNIIILTDEEKEELINKFISNNSSYDMAMFIITQDDISFEEMFLYGDFLNNSFYLETSQHILNYMIGLTEKNNFSEVLNIIQKMHVDVYIPTFGNLAYDKERFRIEDYTQSNILCSLIYYLVDFRKDEELKQLLHVVHSSGLFPEFIIDMIIFDDKVNFDYKIIKDVLFNEYLSRDSFINHFYLLVEKYDEEFLTELLLSIFSNKREMIEMLISLYNRYVFYKREDKFVTELNPLYNNEQYEGFDFILKRIKEVMLLDIETDFYYNFLDHGRRVFVGAKDRKRSFMYDNLVRWYTQLLESSSINRIFLEQEYVDMDKDFPLDKLEIMTLVSDTNCIAYILALTSFDLYDSLIRIINLSRFKFFQVRRRSGIEELIGELITEDTEDIFKQFLNNRFLCFIFSI